MGIHVGPLQMLSWSGTHFTHRNYRPTDSDLEDEENEDEDDLSWLEEEEDDSRRNPNIVDPDIPDDLSPDELSNIIRVDESQFNYGPFRFDRWGVQHEVYRL